MAFPVRSRFVREESRPMSEGIQVTLLNGRYSDLSDASCPSWVGSEGIALEKRSRFVSEASSPTSVGRFARPAACNFSDTTEVPWQVTPVHDELQGSPLAQEESKAELRGYLDKRGIKVMGAGKKSYALGKGTHPGEAQEGKKH